MKKTLTLSLLTLASAIGFADEGKSFFYMKMGLSDYQPTHSTFVPGFGIGYRVIGDASAIDISGDINHRRLRGDVLNKHVYKYNLAKLNYLYYLKPQEEGSLYMGGGMAWGGMHTRDDKEFHGLIPGLNVGYEFNRRSRLRTFTELTVAHPLVPASMRHGLPGPSVEFYAGAGF